jgi:putative ABC transport system ATP-binding protein
MTAAARTSPPLLELRSVSRVFGRGDSEVRALDSIDLVIEESELVAIMGTSGSGKSTCMNLLGCLDRPSSGHYLFRGVSVGDLDRDERAMLRRLHLGFVFQGFHLLPRTSAVENVELPLMYRGVPSRERRERALHALEQVGLAERATHTPNELSGGQQQRVAIARALVGEPSLLLADEPTGNLDTARSEEIMRLLLDLHRARGLTIVIVTHEPDIAAHAPRQIIFRDGHIVADERTDPSSAGGVA